MQFDQPQRSPPKFAPTATGKNATTRNISNSPLLQDQANEMKRQKETEEQIVGVTENLVIHEKRIGEELDMQNELLDKVVGNVDNAQVKIDRTNNRVKRF